MLAHYRRKASTMTTRKHALLALSAMAVLSVLLPSCGSKSNEETPASAKDGAMKSREGGDAANSAATPGTGTNPTATGAPTGSLANPQPPEGSAK